MPPQRTKTPWSKDQRHALYLIFQQVKNSRSRLQIFNYLFDDYLKAHGKNEGRNLGTIHSQYLEHKRPRARALWVGIVFAPFSWEDETRRQMWQARINDACMHFSVSPVDIPQASRSIGAIESRDSLNGGTTAALNQPRLLLDEDTSRPVENIHNPSEGTHPSFYQAYDDPYAERRQPWQYDAIKPSSVEHGPDTHPPVAQSEANDPPLSSATVTAETQTNEKQEIHLLKRTIGPDLELSRAAYNAAMAPLRAIPNDETHLKPLPATLFRLWSASSNGQNSARGFQAAMFERSNIFNSAVPPSEHLCWTSIFLHLNQEQFASPFISCSSSFSWIIRTGLQAAAAGLSGLYVTTIDTNSDLLDNNSIFYAQPFYQELKRKKAFTDGNWVNHGTYEFLVYRKIEASAIISTVAVDDLLAFCATNTAMSNIFRVHFVEDASSAVDASDWQFIKFLAHMVTSLGMSCTSSPEHVSALIDDIVQAPFITVRPASACTWADIANKFVHWLSQATSSPVSMIQVQTTKAGLLDGIAWACGGRQPRALNGRPEQKHKNAARLGLSSPHAIFMAECHAAIHALQTLATSYESVTVADRERSTGLAEQTPVIDPGIGIDQLVDDSANVSDELAARQETVAEDSCLLDWLMK